jgi:Fur family ferric uptake transcriptional regulator
MNTANINLGDGSIADHLALLRSKGLRITPIVTALLSRLAGSHQVRTTSELKTEISKTLGYDVGSPTVYRICERLAATGVLCSMHKSDGILRYFFCANPQNKKHHHFICTRCMKVQEVDCTIDETIREAISDRINGEIESNFIQIEGICGDCRK